MAISAPEFEYVRDLVKSRSGVLLRDKERFLAEARLTPLARQNGAGSVSEFITRVQVSENNGLHDSVLDSLLPKETAFFRDAYSFELLRSHVLRTIEMRRSGERRIRIWCAGCSSGQEPFSVAMMIGRYFSQILSWDIEIYATDLSKEALETAQSARYNKIELNRGVPSNYFKEFFREEEKGFVVSEKLRKVVCFEELNLSEDWPQLEQLDLVLLRNVISYFTPEIRMKVLANVKRVLKTDGYLLLGAGESIDEATTGFRMVPVDKAVYFEHVKTT
ncbi:MAG: methyltransferase [Verrucomicrobia bacterium]|nr:methyltransferase [Verrucomicrobiota bacterium]